MPGRGRAAVRGEPDRDPAVAPARDPDDFKEELGVEKYGADVSSAIPLSNAVSSVFHTTIPSCSSGLIRSGVIEPAARAGRWSPTQAPTAHLSTTGALFSAGCSHL